MSSEVRPQYVPVPGSYNDTTFRSYTSAQVPEYARRRGGYPQKLIDKIISIHTKIGGALNCVLDLGCGPGNATRDLAAHFQHAIGLDPSAEMVKTANEIENNPGNERPIAFMNGEAETCPDIADDSVDLITAGTAAHWFDMERLWPTAARILKHNGTVAFFTIWRIYLYPSSTPDAATIAEIQRILIELETGTGTETLGPYQKSGNWSLMGLYKDLEMPWSSSGLRSSSSVSCFSRSSYQRHLWNGEGRPDGDGSFMCGERLMSLEELEKAIGTISAASRWREAHPEMAHTEKDCIKVAFAKIRGLLKSAGESEQLTMVGPTVLITIKKT